MSGWGGEGNGGQEGGKGKRRKIRKTKGEGEVDGKWKVGGKVGKGGEVGEGGKCKPNTIQRFIPKSFIDQRITNIFTVQCTKSRGLFLIFFVCFCVRFVC